MTLKRRRGSQDLFLRSSDPEETRRAARRRAGLSLALLLFDCTCSLLLLLSLNGWQLHSGLGGLLAFRTNGLDAVCLSLSRLVVLPLIALLAVRLGTPASSSRGSEAEAEALLREPLLHEEGVLDGTSPAESVAEEGGDVPPLVETVEELKAGAVLYERCKARRGLALALLFITCTVLSVWTAVKTVTFAPSRLGALNGTLLGITSLIIVAENVALASAVSSATARRGTLRPALHPHPLFYACDAKIVAHLCDCCRARVTEGFRCGVCDFDCCVACYGKKDPAGAEGGLRGDKGLRTAEDPAPTAFFFRALGLVRSEAPLFALAFVCLFATSAAQLALPNYQGGILDRVFARDVSGFHKQVMQLIVFSGASGLFGGARSLCFSLVGRRLSFVVRNMLLRSILTQDTAFFDAAATGDLTSRLTYDVANMLSPVQTLFSTVLENSVLLIGALVACFLQSWQLTLLAITTLMPATFVTRRYASWSSTLNRHISAALGEGNAAATEALSNIRLVRALSTEDEESAKYEERTQRALTCGVRDACGGALASSLNSYLDLSTTCLILFYGGSLAIRNAEGGGGGLTAGKLVTFQLYFSMFNGSFNSLQNTLSSFTRAAGSAQRVLSLLDSVPDIPKKGGTQLPAPLGCAIQLEEVRFAYQMRPNHPVLDNLSLRVEPESVCALVGRSGGGKSTIVHLLLRLYDPQAGRILFDGVDLRELCLQWTHRQTGFVAQDTQLFAASVADNITYGCPHPVGLEEVRDACVRVHAHDFISAFPDGYDTRCGERGVRLSGGQKQRIAIARALLRKPRLLLLDEATSALDAESEAMVQAALDALIALGGRTVVLVAHRLSTVVNADQICVLADGCVVERGNHASLLRERPDGAYAKLVARQMASKANELGGGEETTPER